MTRLWYGTYRGPKGGVGTFLVDCYDAIPGNSLHVIESAEPRYICREKANELREAVLRDDSSPAKQMDDIIAPGRVCLHDDGKREHVAIVLEVTDDDHVVALFFTGNPEWANGFRGRRARNEELAMVAYKQTKQATYLVRVIRKVEDFRSLRMDVPMHWVEGYLREFPDVNR